MILYRKLHICFKEVFINLIAMFKHEPTSGSIDRKCTDLLPSGANKCGNFFSGELQKTLKGNHRPPQRRGRKRGVRCAYSVYPGNVRVSRVSSCCAARVKSHIV